MIKHFRHEFEALIPKTVQATPAPSPVLAARGPKGSTEARSA